MVEFTSVNKSVSADAVTAQRIVAATDSALALGYDNALADLSLAEMYEHNAHLVPKIRAHLDLIKTEQERRRALHA